MKITTLAIILYLTTAAMADGQVVVLGKINNYDGKSVVWYHPTIEGIHLPYSSSVTPDQNGRFKIRYENNGYGTLSLHYDELYYYFFHDENTTINLTIDQAKIVFPTSSSGVAGGYELRRDSVKQRATVNISGDYQLVNRFYNASPRTSVSELTVEEGYFAGLIRRASTPERAVAVVDSLMQKEFDQINALGADTDTEQTKQLSPEVKRFLENEVRAFYASTFMSAMFLKRTEQSGILLQHPDARPDVYNPKWERLVEDFFSKTSAIQPSSNSGDFNTFVYWLIYTKDYYQRYDVSDPGKTNDENIVDGLLTADSLLVGSLYQLDTRSALAYKLFWLQHFTNNQNSFSPVLLDAFNKLKAQHPDSRLFEQFNPALEKLKAYLKESSLTFNKAQIVETNYLKFNDLLEDYKGKNLLVDVWATWCGPCIDDFNYKSTIQPMIADGSISVLYISIDKERWRKQWRSNINFNQLEGIHYQANETFIQDMWSVLKGYEGAIPRYALVNKKGEIVLSTAARPSNGGELKKQIEDFLLKSNSN